MKYEKFFNKKNLGHFGKRVEVNISKRSIAILLFGDVEGADGKDLGGDLLASGPDLVLHGGLGQLLLLLIVVEDGAHILPGALGSGVVVLPEHSEEGLVAGDLGVVVDLHGLGVVAETVVGRVDLLAAGVPDPRTDDPGGTSELGLGKPESAHPEGRLLRGDGGLGEGHAGGAEVAYLE